MWNFFKKKSDVSVCIRYSRESNAAGIRPVAATPVKPPVAGGVPTPFNSASFYTADSPKPFVNSPAPTLGSPIPGSKSLNRAPSPIVFPPPLPSSQEFSFQQNAKPHVQFRPVETSAFDEHEEELSSITNQVKINYFIIINWHMKETCRSTLARKYQFLDGCLGEPSSYSPPWKSQIINFFVNHTSNRKIFLNRYKSSETCKHINL